MQALQRRCGQTRTRLRKKPCTYGAGASGRFLYAYSPYGETQALGAEQGSANSLQYTGRENDGTGLYYYRARYYDPVLKSFVSDDPLGVAAGLNSRTYVHNNPVTLIDPTGLDAMCGPGAKATPTGQAGVYSCVPNPADKDKPICATAECAAGVPPTRPENRTNDEIDRDLKNRNCKMLCKSVVKNVCPVPLISGPICSMVCD
jgi:RHS repeat-associated protein